MGTVPSLELGRLEQAVAAEPAAESGAAAAVELRAAPATESDAELERLQRRIADETERAERGTTSAPARGRRGRRPVSSEPESAVTVVVPHAQVATVEPGDPLVVDAEPVGAGQSRSTEADAVAAGVEEPEPSAQLDASPDLAPPAAAADPAAKARGPRGRREPRTNIFEAQQAPLDPVEALLEFFRANPKPWHVRDLLRRVPGTDLERLGAGKPEGAKGAAAQKPARALEATLDRLVSEGRLVHTRRHTYGLPEEMNLVVGKFQGHAGGYGFLIPETPGLRDLYIPAESTFNAWNGDRVVARSENRRRGEDSPRGTIIRILERSRDQIVGTLEYSRGYAILRPDDPKVHHRLLLTPEGTADVRAGARIVAGLHWPEDTGEDEPYGRIADVLGDGDSPEVETRAVVVKFGLRNEFSSEALADAERIPLEIPAAALKGRTDMRGKNVFTIDGRDAKDFDDAIHIEPLANGNFLVGVHVADVSHYVVEGKPLDVEARERATSVYLPGLVLPMLPERLSNGVCSLVPDEDRLTMSALVELTADGSVVNATLVNSVIHSRARLTYDEVQAFSEGKSALPERARVVEGDMHLLLKLTSRMRERRFREGSLDFRLREVKVDIGDDGSLRLIPVREETARGLIEDLMLLANKVVAADLTKKNIPALFRVHEEPSETRFSEVTSALGKMGISVRGGAPTPQAYQEILANVRGTPQESSVNTLLLRSMRQAKYSSENLGHFGLAFDDYLHFTSPIRRYPDLVVHRILKASLARKLTIKRKENLQAALPALGDHTSERERNAAEAERDLTKYYQAKWAQAHIGEEHHGLVSGVTNFGVFVSLDNGVEGLMHVSQLDDDYYVFIEDAMLLKGRSTGRSFRLGTSVRIRIQHVNPIARQIDFAPKESEMDPKPRARKPRDARDKARGGPPAADRPAEPAREPVRADERSSARPPQTQGPRRGTGAASGARPGPAGNRGSGEPRGTSARGDARRIVVLHGRPKGEHSRPVKVTARKLYFGEWTRSHLEHADDEGGRPERGSRGGPRPESRGRDERGRDERGPRSAGGEERRPEPERKVERAQPEPARNADRAVRGPVEGRPGSRGVPRFPGADSARPAQPAAPVVAEGQPGSARRRRRRRR